MLATVRPFRAISKKCLFGASYCYRAALGCGPFSEYGISFKKSTFTRRHHTPVIKTKQLYPVHVNHGYLRYVTKEEAEKWEYSIAPQVPLLERQP